MKLSILDQAPISSGQTARQALENSVQLAKLGERYGYDRFWMAEHHDLYGLACPNPSVMLSLIATHTEKIRIGAGAVLLPYYKPFHVAETYNLLATLFPGRVDLGLGRAPGGSAEVSLALSDNYLKQVANYSQLIDELQDFLNGSFPEDSLYAKIKPSPVPEEGPKVWLLGTSEKSAKLAAEKGMAYSFGHFMSHVDGVEVVQAYRDQYEMKHKEKAEVIIAVHAICAKGTEEADELAKSSLAWSLLQESQAIDLQVPSIDEVNAYAWSEEERVRMEKMKRSMILGNPVEVCDQLERLKEDYGADEMMIVTITHEAEKKWESYRLIAEEMKRRKRDIK